MRHVLFGGIATPAEELERYGAAELSDADLLEIVSGCDRGMIDSFLTVHSTHKLAAMDAADLVVFTPEGRARVLAAMELARRAAAKRPAPRDPLTHSGEVFAAWRLRLGRLREEMLMALLLDARMCPAGEVVVARGEVKQAVTSPRAVFTHALRRGAAALMLVHNHPSGDPRPSADDVTFTRGVVEAGKLVDCPLVDHVIVTSERHFSFLDSGMLKKIHTGQTIVL